MTVIAQRYDPPQVLQPKTVEKPARHDKAFAELERGLLAALEIYSNVHRGSGQNSLVSTHWLMFRTSASISGPPLTPPFGREIFCSLSHRERVGVRVNPPTLLAFRIRQA
jgi:hypothetical protein